MNFQYNFLNVKYDFHNFELFKLNFLIITTNL